MKSISGLEETSLSGPGVVAVVVVVPSICVNVVFISCPFSLFI